VADNPREELVLSSTGMLAKESIKRSCARTRIGLVAEDCAAGDKPGSQATGGQGFALEKKGAEGRQPDERENERVRREMKPDAGRNADAESDGGQRCGIPHARP
jgi:hypothetical protein